MNAQAPTSRQLLVASLRRDLAERAGPSQRDLANVVSSGWAELDALLPLGGFVRGGLVEWRCEQPAGGGTLSLLAAWQTVPANKPLVVVDPQQTFYPPAAAAWGVDLMRLMLVRPDGARDTLWAWEQSLRCEAIGSVWGSVDRLDGRAFRRLQLAAEAGGTIGHLLRLPEAARGPSWADVQLTTRPVPNGSHNSIRLALTHCRQGSSGRFIDLDLQPESRTDAIAFSMPVAAQLAGAATDCRARGA